jgi:hypothetical protein
LLIEERKSGIIWVVRGLKGEDENSGFSSPEAQKHGLGDGAAAGGA